MTASARYEIEHVTRYRYTSRVRDSVMALCLKPRGGGAQRLLRFELSSDPPGPVTESRDPFGNARHLLTVHREHEALAITVRSEVELSPPPPLPAALAPDAWEEMRPWAESFTDWEFTHASAFARPSPVLESFARREGLAEPTGDPLSALSALAGALHRAFRYLPGSTSAISPIEHVLESGVGVCQDYAHVMITIARAWGVPSRYVSGYLHAADPPDQPTHAEAGHAWVECRLPGLGWVAFDPTNPGLPRERYVRVAVGRDYGDVSPARGIFRGWAGAELAVEVSVTPRPAV
ncbi:MAG: transglutaminase family protein [Chloroflexi bacterium]|nr:transglutaminase family protein [Chloroflexota bacterium]